MTKLLDEFKESYQQGRADTRAEINATADSGMMSHAHARQLAKFVMLLSSVTGLLAFFFLWQTNRAGLLMSALVGGVAWWIALLVFGFILAMAAKGRRGKA